MSDHRRGTIALTAAMLVAAPAAAADELHFEQFRLDSGARVTIIHVPDATKQVIQTWLPIGYVHEPASHPLIAATAIDSLLPRPEFDSEDTDVTTHWAMPGMSNTVVETKAIPSDWRAALRDHHLPLISETLDYEQLAGAIAHRRHWRDLTVKARAAGLLIDYSAMMWSQIVHQQQRKVALFAPLTLSAFAQVNAWLQPHLGLNASVDIAVIGPVDAPTMRAAVEEVFGRLPASEPVAAVAPPAPPDELIDAQWSEQDRLVILWRPLPNDSAKARALAELVGPQFYGNDFDGGVRLQPGPEGVLVHQAVSIGTETALMITASLQEATDYEVVVNGLQARFNSLADPSDRLVRRILRSAERKAQGLSWPPDFAPLRAGPPDGEGESAEWLWLSSLIHGARHFGVEPLHVSSIYREITAEEVVAFCNALAAAPSRLAVIHPDGAVPLE